ncbi:Midasin [Papilio xuthus]|uniref:Midasin n=1 Tax=Papilio xuthus TaxID=66420 RepID=A0A194QCQ1_PAPXU|nr:Midasin [Papilio xuthus]
MNLSELNMRCVASEGVDRVTFDAILKTLTAIVDAWEKQRKDIEKKKIDDEALYVTKSKCEDEDEDAIAQEEIMEMFPSYSESDFAEFKPPTLEQRKVKLQTDDKKKSQYLITNEDVSLIYKWHSNFAHGMTSAEWLPSPRKLVANNVVSPLLMRYPIFSRLVNNSWEALDAEFEGVISPTLMVILSDIKEKIDGCESSSTKIDFYRSAWVSETKQCLPLLQRVKDATNNLLDQWPDFPTLKDIMIIVERIINFSITSPVSRFLTGLELLRDKIEEWNKNAHKANNMIDISLDVGQQIINWRKLEMSHWKECLNNLYNRKQAEAHKYWFYLYSVVNTYLFESQNDEAVTANRVISVLKEFMESSNLVEYENVLKESVVPYLVDNVSESTEHVGLWDRPKRATGPHAPSGGAYMIDHQNHIVTVRHIKKYLDQADQPCDIIPEGSLLSKIPALMNKAKSLCKDTMFNSGYPSLVQALDDFVTVIIETNTHLTSLEVDTTESKDKQKSQAKNIVQQKRKALADLFKYLSQIGLNYRTGLVILSAEDDLYDFTIPPVDLDAAMNYLKSRRSDATLSLLWSGCEKYFQRNIARHRLLAASLTSPHKDLGMQNIERCKGFSAQLMKLTIKQKKSVAKHSRQLCDLRRIASSLTAALEIEIPESNISTLKEKFSLLSDCYSNTSILLDQFCVLLQSCPEKTLKESCDPEFDSIVSDSAVTRCYKKSDEWNVLYKSIKSIITEVSKQKTVINKLLISTPKQIGQNIFELPILSQSHIDVSNEAKNNLFTIIKKLNEIKEEYQFTLKALVYDEFVSQHPLLRSLNNLDMYLKEIINRLDKLDQSTDVSMEEDTTKLVTDTEDLVATMLLVIQSLYKKHLPIDKNDSESDVLNAIDKLIEDSEGNKDMLEDKHLKERLQENLSNDVKLLQLDALINKMYRLLTDYVQYIATVTHIGDVKIAVSRVVPILEQAILFIQYFVSQKVAVHRVSCKMLSVLLKIFSDLATKGFCKPSDLDMEDGEGAEGPGTSSGMGLGEGEGQKDVSERIENQDQLDDAQKPGEEKKEEDKDCKEEEKGINMTDDFESHLQDVEEKEGDDSEQEDNDDDADKQMGDTDKAAEKLDQQIWGSEDEDDVDEQEKDKDEKGKGESTGEKQMGAKEEEQGTDDGTEGEDKKKKKDINEMEEPEVDDDHIDPHHGKEQKLPEPEDFEMPDDMNVDGEEGEDKEEGETETENPFEIDVMKDVVENEEDDKKDGEEKDNKNGLEVSSDEDDDGDEGNKDDAQEKENADDQDKNDEEESSKQEDENQDGSQEDTSADIPQEIEEQNPELPENENKPEEEELPKNPDEINEEDNVEKKEHEANPQANPSSEDPSMAEKAENAEMDRGANDNVETNAEQAKDEEAAPFEQAQEQVGEDKQSTGRSELDKSDRGHRGEKQAARAEASQDKQKRRENKPGRTDDKRTLGEVNEQKQKRAHTLNVEEEDATEEGGDADNDADKEADAFQHVKQGKKDDLQAIDAATKEQAEQQPTLQQEDEDGEEMKDNEEVPMDVDDDDLQIEKSEEIKPEKMKNGQDKEQEKSGNKKEGGEETTGETGVEVEGETVLTADVPRGRDTTYHTKLEDQVQPTEDITMEQYLSIREYLRMGPTRGAGAVEAWRGAWRDTAAAARALCERLRLVLEPTGRSRRAGDFRTGRAINMRRVIPYIASQFRKDRIWLRRTKPARRDYKIALALDDSSSMADNRSKELAFESLALVSQALNLLESGDLAVISFGEKPNLLHPFSEQFSEHSGAKILDQLRFDQTKTKIAQLLDFCTVLFDEQNIRSDAINAKLLVIVSDGRGIFSEGETRVIQAVRRARQQGIFCVYIIIDNPDNKDSIMDIRRPVMDPVTNTLSGFVSYLDAFPFPFYLLLRDLAALPTVLGDALRQWFELAANVSS